MAAANEPMDATGAMPPDAGSAAVHHERAEEEAVAIAGLVAGSLGLLCGLLGLLGMTLSIYALHRIERSRGRLTGSTTAVIGLVMGAVTAWVWEMGVLLWLHYATGMVLPIVNDLLPRF